MALIDGLISFWEFEEAGGATREDAHGVNDLTDNNTVQTATGVVGFCADFEFNNSEFLSRVDNADLSFGDEDFTICAWVWFESKTNYMGIVCKHASPPDQEYGLYYDQAVDRINWFVSADGTAIGQVNASTLGSPATATWYFVVCWHDSVGNTLKICVDDGTVDSAAWANGVRDGTNIFTVGNLGTTNFMDGLIDQVGLWGRVLTAAEITDLYNAGNGRDYAYIASPGDPRKRFFLH